MASPVIYLRKIHPWPSLCWGLAWALSAGRADRQADHSTGGGGGRSADGGNAKPITEGGEGRGETSLAAPGARPGQGRGPAFPVARAGGGGGGGAESTGPGPAGWARAGAGGRERLPDPPSQLPGPQPELPGAGGQSPPESESSPAELTAWHRPELGPGH